MRDDADGEDDVYDPFWLTGKDLDRHFELQDALLAFASLFKPEGGDDRAMVIVGAAFLETLLEHLHVNFLVDDAKEVASLLRYEQALGTFGNRVGAAYCFGLITPIIRDDLRLVAKIRNRFAHDLYASFEDQQIASWSAALKWHRKAYMESPPGVTARDLFYVGVSQLVGHLDGLVSVVRAEKRIVRRG